jgi:hypothetical protein
MIPNRNRNGHLDLMALISHIPTTEFYLTIAVIGSRKRKRGISQSHQYDVMFSMKAQWIEQGA